VVAKLRRRRAWALVYECGPVACYLRSLIFQGETADTTPSVHDALVYNSRRLASETLRHHLDRNYWRVAPIFVTPSEDR